MRPIDRYYVDSPRKSSSMCTDRGPVRTAIHLLTADSRVVEYQLWQLLVGDIYV